MTDRPTQTPVLAFDACLKMSNLARAPAEAAPSSARQSYRTLTEIVLRRLLEDIIGANIRPGERLAEIKLAERYGVSRGPIREALRILEGQGLVRSEPGKGAHASRLSRDDLREIYDIRVSLEELGAKIGAERITSPDITIMERLLDRMSRTPNSPRRWLALNDAFHMTLYLAAKRERLSNLIKGYMNICMPYALLYVNSPSRLLDTHQDHFVLFDAVRQHNGEQAAAAIREHLGRASNLIVGLLDEDLNRGRP